MEKAQAENGSRQVDVGRRGGASLANFAFGFTVGIAAGLVTAIFLAPKRGRESRQVAREAIGSGINDIKGVFKEATADRKKVYTETWRQPKAKPYSTDYK